MIELFQILILSGFSLIVVLLFYAYDLKFNLNLGDEGYVWFGTKQVLKNKIPIRDFRAYDPGRYYYLALWCLVFGNSLFSTRLAMLFSQVLTIFFGCLIIYFLTESLYYSCLIGVFVAPWLFPRHKQIDTLFSVMTPLVIYMLLSNPSVNSGVTLSLYLFTCFFFGLNHGLYASFSTVFTVSIIFSKDLLGLNSNFFSATLITGIGIIMMFSFIMTRDKELAKTYWDKKVLRILKRKSANLKLPHLWLWNSNTPQLLSFSKNSQIIIKLLFTSMPVLYLGMIIYVCFYLPLISHSILILTLAFSGLAYFHHASSRADISHLSQSILPFILLLSYLCFGVKLFVIFMPVVFIFSIYNIFWLNINWPKFMLAKNKFNKISIDKHNYYLNRNNVKYIEQISELVKQHSEKKDHIVLLPNIITFYPLLDRKPAIYDIFSIYSPSEKEEIEMIEQIKKNEPPFILINNVKIDGQDHLLFSNSHKKVWNFINHNFSRIETTDLPKTHFAFKRK